MNLKYDFFYQKKYNWIIHSCSVLLVFCILYAIFFSPILFSDKLLAPADGFLYCVPAFYSPRTLWTNLLLSGFPVAADIQVQTWYPVSLLFSLIPNSWNAFVVSAYVLASCFSYGYVYTLTKSKLAAFVGGIIYGMSGFMMVHLGHTMMIHAALWMPLIIWALEKLRHHWSSSWFVVGVCAIACSFLAGHPQIFVYSMGLNGVYALALGGSATVGRWKYYGLYLVVLILGVFLTAIQLIPSIDLANLSPRATMKFEEFVSYSLPLHQIPQLIFPYLFGGSPQSFYKLLYFGEWNLTELAGYVGLLPIMLAVIGFLTYENKSITRFWLGIALFTLLLTLGKATPLAQLMYHLPAYSKFRVPARHFVEMALAVSVLAGLGVATLQKQDISNRLTLKTVLASFGVLLITLVAVSLFSGQLQAKAIAVGIQQLTFLPWVNPAVGVPLVIFVLGAATLIYWSQFKNSKFWQLGLIVVLVLDLGSFGWFYEWQLYAPSKDLLMPSVSTQRYKDLLRVSQQRILPVQGGLSGIDGIPPNLSRLWGVPSASGYGPLLLSRVSQLLSMSPAGDISGNWASRANQSLDIMSIRYVFTPKPSTVTDDRGISWSRENMSLALGSGCGTQEQNSIKLQVSEPFSATAIGIVSSLGCSASVSNNAEVLSVLVTDASGKTVTQNLQAGRDTSEWAYECSDVRPDVQHQKAPIFETFPVERTSFISCQGHRYVSIFPLDNSSDIKDIELKWVGSSGAIGIQKISLINGKNKQYYPLTEIADPTRWHHVEDINEISVYENLRAMPRAWLVPEVVSAKSREILNSIKSSKLPDGRYFNPSQIALVKDDLNFKVQNVDTTATAKVVNLSDRIVEVKTKSLSSSFLVLSDIYYPGWKVTVDGMPTHLFQADYVLRGVQLPAGNHTVRFEFKPITFAIGAGISFGVFGLLGYILLKAKINKITS
jgi:hypothetical protein